MLKLLGSPRNYPDLPKLWDGEPITWEAWEKKLPVTHIDPSCDACGLATSQWQATGFYVRSSTGSQWRRKGMRNFHATRCGWCGHTTVYTMHDSQSWELDETDYGEHGSYDKDETETLF